MGAYGVADAKAQLSDLIERSLRGEEVVITRHGKPAVRLLPVEARAATNIAALRAGLARQPKLKRSIAQDIVAERHKSR